jgi:hypothetical protein
LNPNTNKKIKNKSNKMEAVVVAVTPVRSVTPVAVMPVVLRADSARAVKLAAPRVESARAVKLAAPRVESVSVATALRVDVAPDATASKW